MYSRTRRRNVKRKQYCEKSRLYSIVCNAIDSGSNTHMQTNSNDSTHSAAHYILSLTVHEEFRLPKITDHDHHRVATMIAVVVVLGNFLGDRL